MVRGYESEERSAPRGSGTTKSTVLRTGFGAPTSGQAPAGFIFTAGFYRNAQLLVAQRRGHRNRDVMVAA